MKTICGYYEKIGENYESVKRRLCDDEMIKRFVLKFGKDGTFSELSAAMTARELSSAFRAAHTLKGVAANLGFAKLAFFRERTYGNFAERHFRRRRRGFFKNEKRISCGRGRNR